MADTVAFASVLPLLALLGGRANIASLTAAPGRLLVLLRTVPVFDPKQFALAGVRDIGVTATDTVHVLLHADADATGRALLATPS